MGYLGMPEPVEFVRQARRVRTEEAILAAFETVLAAPDGAGGVTIQAVAQEMAESRKTITEGYGGMEGLIRPGPRSARFLFSRGAFPGTGGAAEMLRTDPHAFANNCTLLSRHSTCGIIIFVYIEPRLEEPRTVVDALLELRRDSARLRSRRSSSSASTTGPEPDSSARHSSM